MDHLRIALVLFALFSCPGAADARAQTTAGPRSATPEMWADSARREIDAARRLGDVTRLRAARSLAERASTAHPRDGLLLHYRGFALYSEASLLQGQPAVARRLLEEADTLLQRSAALRPMAETHALRAVVLGQLIGGSPLRGMRLGPASAREMDRAVELGERNPRVWLLRGVSALYTPRMWGGGVDRAEEYLRRAIALAPSDASRAPAPTWGLVDAHVWLGETLNRQGKHPAAQQEFRRALTLEPDHAWARRKLQDTRGGQ